MRRMRSEEKEALKALGENIRRERLLVSLSQEKLGFETGLDRTYVGGIERGERNCTVLKVCLLAQALKTTPSALFEGVRF
jgi:transcriptional regulator with XRE-family HTH domain